MRIMLCVREIVLSLNYLDVLDIHLYSPYVVTGGTIHDYTVTTDHTFHIILYSSDNDDAVHVFLYPAPLRL
jgi:hypothetical protein